MCGGQPGDFRKREQNSRFSRKRNQNSRKKKSPFLRTLEPDVSLGQLFYQEVGCTFTTDVPNLQKEVLTWLFDGKLRADRFRNQWVLDKSSKRGWRNFPEAELDQYLSLANETFSNCEVILMSHKPDEFEEYFFEVPNKDVYWAALESFAKAYMTAKQFRKFLIDVHRSLPALR